MFLWQPPPPKVNTLCKNSLQRLVDGVETDMVFRIIPTDVPDEENDDNGNDISDFTDDEVDLIHEQEEEEPIIVVDSEVEDASSAPFRAEDASSTDRGSESEATASTETESACPNNTNAEGAGSNLVAGSATPAGTTTCDGVSTQRHTDDATHANEGNCKISTRKRIDGATHAKKGNCKISTRKQIDGAGRGANGAEDEVPVAGPSSGVRPRAYEGQLISEGRQIDVAKLGWRTKRFRIPPPGAGCVVHSGRLRESGSSSDGEMGGVRRKVGPLRCVIPPRGIKCSFNVSDDEEEESTSEEEVDDVRRRTTKQGFSAPPRGVGCVVHGRRHGERGNSSDEETGSGSRRTTILAYGVPAYRARCAVQGRRYGERGNSSDEEIGGGVRRRTRQPEYEFRAARTDGAPRPKRDKQDASSTGHQIDAATGRASKAENISAVGRGSVVHRGQGKIGAASATVNKGARAITGGAGSVEREGKEEKEVEGAAWAITKVVSLIERDKQKGAACALIKGDGPEIAEGKPGEEKEIVTVRAHRAVVATRCPLFKRALLSGMLEDINRSIDIHNISPKLFPIFLNYLYTGIIDYASLTPRQITELFLIADCYELFSFKEDCERALKMYIDDNSVLLFFHMSEKYMAPILKDACRKYIKEHPTIPLDNELYADLPQKLKTEIFDLIAWGRDRVLLVSGPSQDELEMAGACALPDDDSDSDAAQVSRPYDWTGRMYWSKAIAIGRSGVRDLNIVAPQPIQYQPSMFLESISGERELITWINLPRWNIPRVDIEDSVPTARTIRFRWGLEQLREIVGSEVRRETLVHVLLAADCDLSRAVNYYYSAS